MKYARIEWERRFLCRSVPREIEGAAGHSLIRDRYLEGQRLRLRAVHPSDGPAVFKLTQKVACPDSRQRQITTLYLAAEEYDRLLALPGHGFVTRRHHLRAANPPIGIDVFEGPLEGLVLAELECDSDEALSRADPPAFAACEVTDDARFEGGTIASRPADRTLSGAREVLDALG